MNIGRNDPCPCGSGKKYKKCCLANDAVPAAVEPDVIAAQRKAHDWLEAHFGKGMKSRVASEYLKLVLDELSDELDEYDSDALLRFIDGLSSTERGILDIGLNEWVLHEALHERHGVPARGIDWVLEAGDIRLTGPQRDFLEAARGSRLRLHLVTNVEAGRGVSLVDLLAPESSPGFVHEVGASRWLAPGAIIGTRVIEIDGRSALGGGLYPLTPIGALEILHDWDSEAMADPLLAGAADLGESLDEEFEEVDVDHQVAVLIRDAWLLDRVEPPLRRAIPSAPEYLTEDKYVVLDFDALADALDSRSDVEAVPYGGGWMHLPSVSEADARGQFILRDHDERGEPGSETITMIAPDEESADAGRRWLDAFAGPHLRHDHRATTLVSDGDPFRAPTWSDRDDGDTSDRTARSRTSEARACREEDYEDWCDEPLAILDDRTPRELLETPAGRLRVELLLRVYDEVETVIAEEENRAPVSFDFLREELGLVD